MFEYPISRNFRGFDVRNAPTDDPFLVGHNLVVGDHLFEQLSVLPTVLILKIHHCIKLFMGFTIFNMGVSRNLFDAKSRQSWQH